MTEFGNRMKEARLKLGINQDELAEKMGLTQAAISQFEKGQRLPTPKTIDKLVVILKVDRKTLAGENQAEFEKELLLRNLKNLSPDSLRKINDIVELIKKK